MINTMRKYRLSIAVFLFAGFILSMAQVHVDNKILILERFMKGGGWLEIFLISFYGAVLVSKMKDPSKTARWRTISWSVFTLVFFVQFLLGIIGFEKFLMTGELHLPVPALIITGPIYRAEVSFMTLLFISTVLLTGPAWCSHLCYFGAIDNLAAKGKSRSQGFQRKGKIKHMILLVVVLFAILFRFAGIEPLYALVGGIGIGVIGLIIIYFYSRKINMMAHCTLFCPVGTLVMYLKHINPFRMVIDSSCTQCGLCSGSCKYDALQMKNIARGKPGSTCTYCGDCINTCHQGAIRYKLFGLSSHKSRNFYLFMTVSIHVVFLALAKI